MKLRFAIAAVTACLVVLAGAAVLPRLGDERWAEMQAWAQRCEREWRQRSFVRAPLHGLGSDGGAFAAYAAALQQALALERGDHDLLRDLRLSPGEVAPASAEAFALRWRGPLLALAEGARRRDAVPAIDWSKGFANQTIQLLPGRALTNAAVIEARRRLAAGQPLAAAHQVLDAIAFATDLRQSPLLIDQVIATSLLAIATSEALRDGDLRQLDGEALAALALGLERADARWAPCCDPTGELALLAQTLQRARGAADPGAAPTAAPLDVRAGWRHGFSARWAEADAVMALVDAAAAMQRAADGPWSVRRAALEQHQQRFAASDNSIVRSIAPQWSGIERTLRLGLVHLRFLRLAVALHQGAALPALPDALGAGDLQVTRDPAGAVLSSQGGSAEQPLRRVVPAR